MPSEEETSPRRDERRPGNSAREQSPGRPPRAAHARDQRTEQPRRPRRDDGGRGGEREGATGRSGAGHDRRPPRPDRPPEPEIAEGVDWLQLDRVARARLRTLSKANAERVGQHLVMAGRLMDENADLAYEHAQAAVRRAGRVDVVREAAALTAYASGRYAEALRELRTVRRLSGVDAHRAVEADCERGLGRPDRALAIIAEAPAQLPMDDRVELAIVEAGARSDLGEHEAALSALERFSVADLPGESAARLDEARHDVLVALGRAQPSNDVSDGEEGDEVPDLDVVTIDDVLEDPQ